MKMARLVVTFALMLTVTISTVAQSREFFHFQSRDLQLEILTEAEFQNLYGGNPEIPRTPDSILALARELYRPSDQIATTGREEEWCQQHKLSLLFAALKNPDIPELTRQNVDQIMAEGVPSLPKTLYGGHFIFHYTDNDPDPRHNVTETEVGYTSRYMNASWSYFTAHGFKKPKSFLYQGQDTIHVYIYYISDTSYGRTASDGYFIDLNSVLTVKSLCRAKTIGAHELFHRIQYSYGYITNTPAMNWMVEGTACWAQKFTYKGYGDYLRDMNKGLNTPGQALLSRGQDACHFWVYMGQYSTTVIQNLWATYQNNGKNAKAAVDTVVKAIPGLNYWANFSFEGYVQLWSKINYVKDLIKPGFEALYDYSYEDELKITSCNETFGPLGHVPQYTNDTIYNNATSFLRIKSVPPYGARYHKLVIQSYVTLLKIHIQGNTLGNFSFHFIGSKNGELRNITDSLQNSFTYEVPLNPGQWDKLTLVVTGRSKGGTYTIKVGP